MIFRVLLLMTVVPLVELWLLFVIAEHSGWKFTIGLVLTTGLVGAWLARWQGWRAMQRIRAELTAGKTPGGPLLDGVLIFVAGVLLVTPGVLTDSAGFLLLIPPSRAWVRRYLARWFRSRFHVDVRGFPGGRADGPTNEDKRDHIIDSYVIDAEKPDVEE